jgi:hypothetical protein
MTERKQLQKQSNGPEKEKHKEIMGESFILCKQENKAE